MKLPWRRQSKKQPKPVKPSVDTVSPSVESHVKGFGDLEDFTVLRHHAVRALCGFLMDRHSSCRSPHLFCNIRMHRGMEGDGPQQFIADVIPQGSPDSDVPNIIAVYLTRAKIVKEYGKDETVDPMDYISRMAPADPVPATKLVVEPPIAGVYPAMIGPVINPVQGDYSTGRLDRERARLVNDCNPEPKHCRWTYWEFKGSDFNPEGKLVIPRFLGLQVSGQWWIASGYNDQTAIQQVAGLEVADSPRHNFGLHNDDLENKITMITDNYKSEYSKIVRENVPSYPRVEIG